MGAGKTAGYGWQQVPVLLRSDIIAAAERERLDISEECNRALAQRLEIEYRPPLHRPVESKVIVAPDGPVKQSIQAPASPPVINAEDPTVPGKVLREKKEKKGPVATKPREVAPLPPAAPPVVPAGTKPKTGRTGKKVEAIPRFVSTRIIRESEESPDAIIAKDELYERFERWCRDHSYVSIPERRIFSVSLKNKYAFTERIVGGIPSWVNIRIK